MSFGGNTMGERQDTARLLQLLERIADALEEANRLATQEK